jgi:hypothetical protein
MFKAVQNFSRHFLLLRRYDLLCPRPQKKLSNWIGFIPWLAFRHDRPTCLRETYRRNMQTDFAGFCPIEEDYRVTALVVCWRRKGINPVSLQKDMAHSSGTCPTQSPTGRSNDPAYDRWYYTRLDRFSCGGRQGSVSAGRQVFKPLFDSANQNGFGDRSLWNRFQQIGCSAISDLLDCLRLVTGKLVTKKEDILGGNEHPNGTAFLNHVRLQRRRARRADGSGLDLCCQENLRRIGLSDNNVRPQQHGFSVAPKAEITEDMRTSPADAVHGT